mmetsp:Transcript_39195/g.63163  ORF Transcript_39195/g.63163 Transcript_39195/m.63163 type:complete len:237 (-) Transcript_39195:40-750(-)
MISGSHAVIQEHTVMVHSIDAALAAAAVVRAFRLFCIALVTPSVLCITIPRARGRTLSFFRACSRCQVRRGLAWVDAGTPVEVGKRVHSDVHNKNPEQHTHGGVWVGEEARRHQHEAPDGDQACEHNGKVERGSSRAEEEYFVTDALRRVLVASESGAHLGVPMSTRVSSACPVRPLQLQQFFADAAPHDASTNPRRPQSRLAMAALHVKHFISKSVPRYLTRHLLRRGSCGGSCV